MSSSSNSPCAACKFLRRKCTHECVFAPYFPPDQPQKFANVHKVFGASNVAKLLNDLLPSQREDAVNSLAYEAEARLRDPVYGCVGLISILQNKLKQVQVDLYNAKKELATYIGPSAMLPLTHQHVLQQHHPAGPSSSAAAMGPFGMPMGLGPQAQMMMREQQMIEAQHQLAAAMAAREQQEMMRSYEHQQQELSMFNGGAAAGGFNQIAAGQAGSPAPLTLVPFDNNPFQVQQQQEQEHQQPQPQHHHHRTGSDEGGSSVGPP